MGIGKTMQAIGLSEIYSSDYKVVVEALAKRLECNIELDSYNGTDFDLAIPEPQVFDFGCNRTYDLYVQYFDIDIKNPDINNIYCDYQFTIPNAQPNHEEIEIDFHPDNIIHVLFLDFEVRWEYLFDTVFCTRQNQDHKVKFSEYQNIRHAYWEILSKIGCNQIMIFTDFHYKLEDEFFEKKDKVNSFDEIIQYAKQIDNLIALNLGTVMSISSQNYSPWNPPEFNDRDCYAYVFIDESDAEAKENELVWKPK